MSTKKNQNAPVTVDTSTSRKFLYTKNGVTLDFTLRTDTKQQLKDFRECMIKALEDLDLEISK